MNKGASLNASESAPTPKLDLDRASSNPKINQYEVAITMIVTLRLTRLRV